MSIFISLIIYTTLIISSNGDIVDIPIENENHTLPCPLQCLSTFYYGKMDKFLFENTNVSEEFYGPTNNIEGDITQFTAVQFRKFCMRDMKRYFHFISNRKTNHFMSSSDANVQLKSGFVYRPFASCLRKCAYSVLRQDITKMLRPVKFLCVDNYHEIRLHFDCYVRIKREYGPCCKKLYCETDKNITRNHASPRHNPKFRIMRQRSKRPNQDEEQLRSCRLLKCSLPCEREFIQRDCGSAMAKLMTIDFIKVYLDSSKMLMVNSRASWPEDCEKVL